MEEKEKPLKGMWGSKDYLNKRKDYISKEYTDRLLDLEFLEEIYNDNCLIELDSKDIEAIARGRANFISDVIEVAKSEAKLYFEAKKNEFEDHI